MNSGAKAREMLEKALYFFVENASKQELEKEFEWYEIEDKDIEHLIDIMFESYLDNFEGDELIKRINYLFLLDDMSNEKRFEKYNKFLNRDNNNDLFELRIGVVE